MTIINYLISNQANILVHDRADRTFVHQAVSVLSIKHFEDLLKLIKEQEHINFEDIFTYIDEDDFDIVNYCIKHKAFDKLAVLLKFNPDYFAHNFSGKDMTQNVTAFKTATEVYTNDEIETLYNILLEHSNPKFAELMDELDLLNPDKMSSISFK